MRCKYMYVLKTSQLLHVVTPVRWVLLLARYYSHSSKRHHRRQGEYLVICLQSKNSELLVICVALPVYNLTLLFMCPHFSQCDSQITPCCLR